MEAQSERLYSETKSVLDKFKPLTKHLVGKLLADGEMSLSETMFEIRERGRSIFRQRRWGLTRGGARGSNITTRFDECRNGRTDTISAQNRAQ